MRKSDRYASNLSNAEWRLVEPFLPPPATTGRPRKWLLREIVDAILRMGGYAGPKLKKALAKMGDWTIEVIKRSDRVKGFEKLPRRWVVERTFAWLGHCRRLAKDFEKTIQSALAWLIITHIRRVTRYLVRN